MLTIKNLTVAYDKQEVLQGLNAELQPAAIHGFVGLNGAGKTTLFHTIYGWIKPNSGEISWHGQPLRRTDMAFLETKNHFYSDITGNEFLSLFRAPKTFNTAAWQELFRLPLDDFIETYSTGMKKKLALAGILKLDKPILLLDEPFNGIDLEAVNVMKLLLEQLRRNGKTILITSHVLETLTSICDEIHYLEDGKVIRSFKQNEMNTIEDVIFKETKTTINALIQKGLS